MHIIHTNLVSFFRLRFVPFVVVFFNGNWPMIWEFRVRAQSLRHVNSIPKFSCRFSSRIKRFWLACYCVRAQITWANVLVLRTFTLFHNLITKNPIKFHQFFLLIFCNLPSTVIFISGCVNNINSNLFVSAFLNDIKRRNIDIRWLWISGKRSVHGHMDWRFVMKMKQIKSLLYHRNLTITTATLNTNRWIAIRDSAIQRYHVIDNKWQLTEIATRHVYSAFDGPALIHHWYLWEV